MNANDILELTPEMERELIAMAKNHIRRRPHAGSKGVDPEVRAKAQGRTQQLIDAAFSLLH
jgi:hypothetical protein